MKVETNIKVNQNTVAEMAATKAGRALLHAARYVRKVARNSIKRVPKKKRNQSYSKQASAPGTPPHTRSGRLKKAILYEITEQRRKRDWPRLISSPASAVARRGGTRHQEKAKIQAEQNRADCLHRILHT